MDEKNWPLLSAKAYLLILVGVFAACLFTALVVAEVWRFCCCGDVCYLLVGSGALLLTIFFGIFLKRFLVRNKDMRV